MITILVDHDIEGQAALLGSTFVTGGWLEFTPLQFVTFAQIGLAQASPDRSVWEFAQQQRLLLLTGNRNMDGNDSLEQTIQEANTVFPRGSFLVTIVGIVSQVQKRSRSAITLQSDAQPSGE